MDLQSKMVLGILDEYDASSKKVGLVIVDEVNGFVTPGMGALAPPVTDAVIERMVYNTHVLAHDFAVEDRPILVLNERHEKGVPEPPYPPHCEEGSGEDVMPPKLEWLYQYHNATIVYKNCINGFVGGMFRYDVSDSLANKVSSWVKNKQIEVIIVVGICTDICVMQFVQTMLSARNKMFKNGSKLMPTLKDVVVWTEACSTYDLPLEVARSLNIPDTLAHPREETHFMGLYLMQGSGAILAKNIKL